MSKVFFFESSREHYKADAAIFWCIDDRFRPLLKGFIKQRGFSFVDIFQTAGGAKWFGEQYSPEKTFLLNQLKTSIDLHGTKLAILMLHMDCGGYDNSKFNNDHDAQFHHHEKKLLKAEQLLRHQFPDLKTELYIADFDALHRIMP